MTRYHHNFHEFFTLTKNPNNATNALAVCNWCIAKHGGLGAAQIKPECYTANHACLCHTSANLIWCNIMKFYTSVIFCKFTEPSKDSISIIFCKFTV